MDNLPFVLLGLRTSVRADSACSASYLLYGGSLRLPGDLLDPPAHVPSATDFCQHLRSVIGASSPMPVVHHGVTPSRVPGALSTASHVFLRVDAVRRPLVPPYDGPFAVLHRTDKVFTILKNQKAITVSVDRLKPAHALPSSPPASAASSPVSSAVIPSATATISPPTSVPVRSPSTSADRPSSRRRAASPDPPVSPSSLDPAEWPLPTRYGRRPRPPSRLNL